MWGARLTKPMRKPHTDRPRTQPSWALASPKRESNLEPSSCKEAVRGRARQCTTTCVSVCTVCVYVRIYMCIHVELICLCIYVELICLCIYVELICLCIYVELLCLYIYVELLFLCIYAALEAKVNSHCAHRSLLDHTLHVLQPSNTLQGLSLMQDRT